MCLISFDAIMMEMGMISLKQMDRVFIKPAADLAKRRQCDAVFMRKHTNHPDDFTNPNPNSSSQFRDGGDYVSFDLDSYSSNQLRELKKRLNLELEQVRFLRERIESGAFTTPAHEIGVANKTTKKKKKTSHSHGRLDLESERALRSTMSTRGKLLEKLMKHKWSWVFKTPVDVLGLGLQDYHLIVKKPMDLGTVKTNLEKGFYRSPVDFASDVRLTFTNALAYNPKGQDVYKMAEKLLSQFDVWFSPTLKKFEAQQQGSSSRPPVVSELNQRLSENARKGPEQISIAKKLDSLKPLPTLPPPVMELPRVPSPPPSPVQPPPPQPVSKVESPPPPPQPVNQVEASVEVGEAPKGRKGKLPKPKAKDPNKREMTMEEKAKLGVNLQELPPEKLGQLIQILKKRTTNLPQDGDEIELDIEELDNETLWELDRFVTNYKKMASKIKRQGFIQNLSTPTRNMPPVMEMGSAEKRVRKGGDGGEEDVDIGEDIPIEDYPSVEIERDGTAATAGSSSSGSSSSSGGSSSSDSESGSSSGSDSDADSVQSPFVEAKE
uniref:Bromo domain-containing protein n=1 Tax=Brassica campestris TaxID=3711 RepID=M4CPD0_BRACM